MKRVFIITGLMLAACITAGVYMLYTGITGYIRQKEITGEYAETIGYFTGYSIYSEGGRKAGGEYDAPAYRLTYGYIVDGREYTVSTDYGTGTIPERNSTKEVFYDPQNPADAILGGTGGNVWRIFGGAFFVAVPAIMILTFMTGLGYIDVKRFDLVKGLAGLLFICFGTAVIYLHAGSFAPDAVWDAFGMWIFVPLAMIAAGAAAVAGAFSKKSA